MKHRENYFKVNLNYFFLKSSYNLYVDLFFFNL